MSTNEINPTKKTDDYLTENSNFNPNENVDAVGGFKYQSWNGGTGVGSKGNVEKLASDYINYNYDSFTKGSDYASLAKRYSDNGRKAMEDTVGQIAARTGGLASSYATVAGQQTYGDWMTKLEDAARSLYDSQKSEKMNAYNLAQGLYDRGYSEYSDGYDRAFNEWKAKIGIAQGKDTNAMEMYNTGIGVAQWQDEVTTDQNNKDVDRNDELRQEEEDSLYDYIYAGNSYDSYDAYVTANNGNTLLTEADFNRIVGTATGTYKNNNRQEEEDSLYDFIYAGGSYGSYTDYVTANPNTALTEADFNRIVGTATGTYTNDNRQYRDNDLMSILNNEDFIWGDWDRDGKVGAADEDGEGSADDFFGGSSYGEEYWKDYYDSEKNSRLATNFQNKFNAAFAAGEDVLGMDFETFQKTYGVTAPDGFGELEYKAMQAEAKAAISGEYKPNMDATEVNGYFERYEKGLNGEEGGSKFITSGMLKAYKYYNDGVGFYEQMFENNKVSDKDVDSVMKQWLELDSESLFEYLYSYGVDIGEKDADNISVEGITNPAVLWYVNYLKSENEDQKQDTDITMVPAT